MPALTLHDGFCAQSVAFSPWDETAFVVCAGQDSSFTPSGAVYVASLSFGSSDTITQVKAEEGIQLLSRALDVSFSETDSALTYIASGQDITILSHKPHTTSRTHTNLKQTLRAHHDPVTVVQCNTLTNDRFLTASSGGEIKLWSTTRNWQPLCTLTPPSTTTPPPHTTPPAVTDATWSTHDPTQLCSVTLDGCLHLWDTRLSPTSPSCSTASVGSGDHNDNNNGSNKGKPLFAVDGNPYDPHVVVTAAGDACVYLWDLRKLRQPVVVLANGHHAAVRDVRFSPHSRTELVSAGEDGVVCHWGLNRPPPGGAEGGALGLVARYRHHGRKEPVVGVDWSRFRPGVLCSAGGRGRVFVWRLGRPAGEGESGGGGLPALRMVEPVEPEGKPGGEGKGSVFCKEGRTDRVNGSLCSGTGTYPRPTTQPPAAPIPSSRPPAPPIPNTRPPARAGIF